MLVIRSDQFTLLSEQKKATLLETIHDFLSSEFPAETRLLCEEELTRHCAESAALCKQLGLTDYHSTVWFAAIRLTVHPRFYEHPNIASALAADDSDSDRIAAVLERTTELDWTEARLLSGI